MTKAFIAYELSARRLAVRLWDELRWHGLDVGIDLQDAPPHLERSAVLEDIVFGCEVLIVLVGEQSSPECRRLHTLALEQEALVIALILPRGDLPPELQSTNALVFRHYEHTVEQLLELIPAHLLDKSPDEDQVLANLRHKDADVRRTTLFLVGKDRLHTAMTPAIRLMLTDPLPAVRAAAAYAVDRLGNVEAASALVAAMFDTSFEVRSNAGWGLVHLGRRRDSPASRAITQQVISVLRDSNSQNAREMAYLVLLRLGGEDANAAIKQYWDGQH